MQRRGIAEVERRRTIEEQCRYEAEYHRRQEEEMRMIKAEYEARVEEVRRW